MNEITVVLVDDHPIVRSGLAAVFAAESRYRVIAELDHIDESLSVIRDHRPRLAVIDLMLGDTLSLPLLRQVARESPETAILCISMHSEAAYGADAAMAGAMGYLTKSTVGGTILQAADAVLRGVPFFSADTQKQLLDRARGVRVSGDAAPTLTAREREILSYIGLGETKQRIGERIGRSANTVEAHRSNIKRKLGIETNAELIRYATLHCPVAGEGDGTV